MKDILEITLICPECNIPFTQKSKKLKTFCTRSCAVKSNGKRNKGKKHSDEINKSKGFLGSLNSFYGKRHSEETKQIIRSKRVGKKHTKESKLKISECNKGESNAFYGKQHTEESKLKISQNHADLSGENNPMFGQGFKLKGEKNGSWKGGVSKELYGEDCTSELKTTIRKRDKFVCCICANNGFTVHHIDYIKRNNTEKNLITVCSSCHGKTNFNREEWTKIFMEKIKDIYEK